MNINTHSAPSSSKNQRHVIVVLVLLSGVIAVPAQSQQANTATTTANRAASPFSLKESSKLLCPEQKRAPKVHQTFHGQFRADKGVYFVVTHQVCEIERARRAQRATEKRFRPKSTVTLFYRHQGQIKRLLQVPLRHTTKQCVKLQTLNRYDLMCLGTDGMTEAVWRLRFRIHPRDTSRLSVRQPADSSCKQSALIRERFQRIWAKGSTLYIAANATRCVAQRVKGKVVIQLKRVQLEHTTRISYINGTSDNKTYLVEGKKKTLLAYPYHPVIRASKQSTNRQEDFWTPRNVFKSKKPPKSSSTPTRPPTIRTYKYWDKKGHNAAIVRRIVQMNQTKIQICCAD